MSIWGTQGTPKDPNATYREVPRWPYPRPYASGSCGRKLITSQKNFAYGGAKPSPHEALNGMNNHCRPETRR